MSTDSLAGRFKAGRGAGSVGTVWKVPHGAECRGEQQIRHHSETARLAPMALPKRLTARRARAAPRSPLRLRSRRASPRWGSRQYSVHPGSQCQPRSEDQCFWRAPD
jgi:hypothetical protein